jgi:hypothetical protein
MKMKYFWRNENNENQAAKIMASRRAHDQTGVSRKNGVMKISNNGGERK